MYLGKMTDGFGAEFFAAFQMEISDVI